MPALYAVYRSHDIPLVSDALSFDFNNKSFYTLQ